jgi:DNA-binding NarL/FixJ family response regulator
MLQPAVGQMISDDGRPSTSSITIVLADSRPIMLDALERLFEAEGFAVAARCLDGDETLRNVRKLQPDILMLDLRLPRRDGLAVLREMRRDNLRTRSIVLTSNPDESDVSEALRLGVRGVFLAEMPSHLLVECIRKVHAGEQWFEKRSAGRLLDKLIRREVATRQLALDLTPREMEIVRLVAEGLGNKAIAERLFVQEGTVKVHLHNIYRKLSVDNRVALMAYAHKKGFV